MKNLGRYNNDLSVPRKQDVDGKYTKPEGGIPKSDLSDDVQASIEKANSALQEAVQSDWDQNDETQPDYVKNRPCVVGEDGALEWIVPPVSDETILNALKEIDALPVVAEDSKIFTANQKIIFW